ncbi:MAG: hypothetical protein IJQ31_10340 [Thermoguttaceae bacterium]|nr:hypothetical protein [Thermoguttaceae bacterium]
MERTENTIEETRDVNLTAIIGGCIGFLSPLAIFSQNLLFIPIIAMALILLAGFLRLIHRAPMIGMKLALISFYVTLFCGVTGGVSARVYRLNEMKSARHFAAQWFELMTTGRNLEAIQLQRTKNQRAKGVGILKRYTTEKEYMDEYKAFMENDAVRSILRDFQGAQMQFKRIERVTFSRRLTSFFVVFELSKGEGNMRTSREFQIQIAAAKENSEKDPHYDWTVRLMEALP